MVTPAGRVKVLFFGVVLYEMLRIIRQFMIRGRMVPMARFDADPFLSRREWLGRGAGLTFAFTKRIAAGAAQSKRIAAVITEYRQDSHADVIVGRLLEGYEYNGRHQTPQVEVVSMYTDQVPSNDMSRAMAAKHGVKICSTIRNALVGDKGLAVQGVVLIGEHGNYPENEKGQKLYPRYELFKQIVDVFSETGHSAPVFCDKHLSVRLAEGQVDVRPIAHFALSPDGRLIHRHDLAAPSARTRDGSARGEECGRVLQ